MGPKFFSVSEKPNNYFCFVKITSVLDYNFVKNHCFVVESGDGKKSSEWTEEEIEYLDESGSVIFTGKVVRSVEPGIVDHVMVGVLKKPILNASAIARVLAMKEIKAVVGLSWEPKLPNLSSTTPSGSSSYTKAQPTQPESSILWKASTELVDGLFVPPNNPRKLNKLLRKQVKDTAGSSWFDIPAPTMTPELQKDLQLLKLRNAMDPKRHYKKGESKSTKYFQVGTVIESPLDFFSGRLTKKERKASLADELLSDRTLSEYRKRKVREIEETNRPAGNEKWKIKGKQTRKRAKQRRH